MVKIIKIFFVGLAVILLPFGCNHNRGAQLPPPPLPTGLSNQTCPAPVPSMNTVLSHSTGDANNPVIIAKERGFYVSWWDWFGKYPTIGGLHINDDGLPTSEETVFPGQKKCSLPSLAADAHGIHLAWLDGSEAKSVQIDQNEQAPLTYGTTTRYTQAGPYGALLWEELGTLWFRNNGMLGFANKEGIIPEPKPVAVAKGGIESPAIAWTGEFYGIVWSDSVSGGRNIMLQRITNDGRILGPQVRISAVGGHNNRPQILWTGTDFAIAWTNAAPAAQNPMGNYRIFMAVVAKEGLRPSITKQLDFNGSADRVSLATTGAELAMAWVGTKNPAGSAVYFRRFDLAGNPIGEQLRVSDDEPIAVGRPDLAFGNNGYGVVWHDSREFEGAEIYFSFLACSASELPPQSPAPKPSPPADAPELKKAF